MSTCEHRGQSNYVADLKKHIFINKYAENCPICTIIDYAEKYVEEQPSRAEIAHEANILKRGVIAELLRAGVKRKLEVRSTIKIKTSEYDFQSTIFVGPSPEYRLNHEGKIVSIKLFGQVIYLPEPVKIETVVFEDEEAVIIDFCDIDEFDDIEDWGKTQ